MLWERPSECGFSGISTTHSGCRRCSLLPRLTISGSTQMPKSSPRAFTLRQIPPRPSGSFFGFGSQSPSECLSSSRSPNHPSSMTKSSIPRSRARLARETSFLSLKSKPTASQLFRRTGRLRLFQNPRTTCSRTNLCIRWLIPLKPSPEYAMTASGASRRSPGPKTQEKESGLIPETKRVFP